jgi:DNA-binding transcriptional ArsR family regulator
VHPRTPKVASSGRTAIEKAFEVCEALSRNPRGLSVAELARTLNLPPPTVHRLLSLLKRRGYVRQDEDTSRYSLTLKMLDLSFRFLGRSELRLHAYPVLREYVLRTGLRGFIAIPSLGEITYIWSTGPDEVAMRTVYGRKIGPPAVDGDGVQRLMSTGAAVHDYTETEVARVGIFGHGSHGSQDHAAPSAHQHDAVELARHISMRLGFVASGALGQSA